MSYFIQPSNQLCRAKKRLIKNAHSTAHKGRLLLTLLLLLLTATTTWADNVTLTSSTTSWTNGNTYVTNGDVTIANRITVTGNVDGHGTQRQGCCISNLELRRAASTITSRRVLFQPETELINT